MIKKASRVMNAGGVIAFPTETVFGLGARIDRPEAVKKIFALKKRPRNKPLQILVANLEQARKLGKFDKKALAFAEENWPGPYTLVVKKTAKVIKVITGGRLTVGLRMPDHKVALELTKKAGPIAATSANVSGKKPFLTAAQVKKGLKGLDLVLNGRIRTGQASQVIDATKGFKILRP